MRAPFIAVALSIVLAACTSEQPPALDESSPTSVAPATATTAVESEPQPTATVEAPPAVDTFDPARVFPARVEGEFEIDGFELLVTSVAFDNRFPSERFADRVYRGDDGTVRVEVLLTAGEVGANRFRSVVSDASGREIVVAVCERGDCGGFGPPSNDALTVLHRSTDGGRQVVATENGPAALLESRENACQGIEVRRPALPGGSRCISGHSARWAPDARSFAYSSGTDILVFNVETGDARVVATGARAGDANTGTLARWNEAGTHLLVQWPWGDLGWSE